MVGKRQKETGDVACAHLQSKALVLAAMVERFLLTPFLHFFSSRKVASLTLKLTRTRLQRNTAGLRLETGVGALATPLL